MARGLDQTAARDSTRSLPWQQNSKPKIFEISQSHSQGDHTHDLYESKPIRKTLLCCPFVCFTGYKQNDSFVCQRVEINHVCRVLTLRPGCPPLRQLTSA